MKKVLNLWMMLCVMMLAGIVTACEEPDETPKPPVDETPYGNTYTLNGTEYSFGSVAMMMVGDNLSLIATPTKNVSSAESILECDEYFFGAVNPVLVGETIDVTTEQGLFTVISTLSGAYIETLAPTFTDEVTSGTMTLSNNDGKVSLVAELVLADGTELSVNMEAEARAEINENIIARGEERGVLRSSFYQVENGVVGLWFSVSEIDYYNELMLNDGPWSATWYTHLELSEELMGRSLDIQNLPQNSAFLFEVVDNVNASNSFVITCDDLQQASGSCSVEEIDDEVYRVLLKLTVKGVIYEITFEGECVSSAETRPINNESYITYGKGKDVQKISLVSATIDTATDVWVVELTATDQSIFTATIPSNFFTGEAKGFSQSPNLTISYNGRTYSKANGDSGTVFAAYDEATSQLNFEFIGYDDLDCIYKGQCLKR